MSRIGRADDLRDDLDAAGISRIHVRDAGGGHLTEPWVGGDRSSLPSYDARKLNAPAPSPRAGHVFAWDPGAAEVMPINPKGPGLLGTGCGLPLGGHNHG